MSYRLGRRSLKRLVGVHPALAFAVQEAIKITEVDFGVLDGVRSMARQKELVRQGKSKTYRSYHLYGLAVDLVPYMDGKYTWESTEAFKKIEKAMNTVIQKYNLPVDWGFKMWGWDKPHWQMTGFRDRYDIRKIDPRRFG